MKRKVFCRFLKRKLEGMNKIVFPGKIGERIFNEISNKAWEQWMKKQTILINEKNLNTLKSRDRKFLESEMKKFLFKDDNIVES